MLCLAAYGGHTVFLIVGVVLFFMTLWYIAALWVQRLHDFGFGGRWAWAFIFLHFCAKGVPMFWFPLLVLYVIILFVPGTKGENRYGP